jgi:hypothetical protein
MQILYKAQHMHLKDTYIRSDVFEVSLNYVDIYI